MSYQLMSRVARHGRVLFGGTSWVLTGAVLAGLGAYVFQVVGAHALGEDAFAPISVLWTLQYLALSVPLISVETFLTRSFSTGDIAMARSHHRTMAQWVVAIAAVVALCTYIWRDELVGGSGDLAGVAGLTVLAYGLVVLARGEAAGREAFRPYGVITGAESILRLLVAAPVAIWVSTTRSLAWTMPLGPALAGGWWYLFGRSRALPPPAEAVGVPNGNSPTRFLAATVIANGSAQVLVAGGPLVLAVLGAGAAEVSVFFVTITAARIPIVLAYGGLLSRVLPPLLRVTHRGEVRRMRRIVLLIAGTTATVAALGGVLARVIGPTVVAWFFGAAFRPAATLAAAAAAGILLASGAMLLGQVIIAQAGEARLVIPWVAALAAAVVVVVMLSTDPTARLSVALIVGECTALATLTLRAAAWRPEHGDRHSPPAPPPHPTSSEPQGTWPQPDAEHAQPDSSSRFDAW